MAAHLEKWSPSKINWVVEDKKIVFADEKWYLPNEAGEVSWDISK